MGSPGREIMPGVGELFRTLVMVIPPAPAPCTPPCSSSSAPPACWFLPLAVILLNIFSLRAGAGAESVGVEVRLAVSRTGLPVSADSSRGVLQTGLNQLGQSS